MPLYRISLPAYIREIEADDNEQALDQFWFDYDQAREDPEWDTPTVKVITKQETRNRTPRR